MKKLTVALALGSILMAGCNLTYEQRQGMGRALQSFGNDVRDRQARDERQNIDNHNKMIAESNRQRELNDMQGRIHQLEQQQR